MRCRRAVEVTRCVVVVMMTDELSLLALIDMIDWLIDEMTHTVFTDCVHCANVYVNKLCIMYSFGHCIVSVYVLQVTYDCCLCYWALTL